MERKTNYIPFGLTYGNLITISVLLISSWSVYRVLGQSKHHNGDTKFLAEVRKSAEKTVHLVQTENWSDLRQQFTPLLRFLLSEVLIKQAWSMLVLTNGALQSTGPPNISSGWFTTVKVPLHFARGNLAIVIRMTSRGGIVGLRLLPLSQAGLGDPWTPPPYATTGASRSEDLQLGSKLKVKGLLSLPKHSGPHPCVILIAGSGPCDRDSSVGAKKPFADLALGFAELGLAAIRFDKVTLTHSRRFVNSTTVTLTDEYMEQALDAIRYALDHSEIDSKRIYVLGHSLGGIIALHIAHINPAVKGCIVMAGPVEPIYRSYVRQLRYLGTMDGELSDAAKQAIEEAERAADRADDMNLDLKIESKLLPFGLPPSYWLDSRKFHPISTAETMKKPIMVIQGSRDYQVTPTDDYAQWISVLERKDNAILCLYEGLDHVFVRGEGASTPADYDIRGNVDKVVVDDIGRWINSIT